VIEDQITTLSWVPQLNARMVIRIWPVSCENSPYSGTHGVYLGAPVLAGQRGCTVSSLTSFCRRQRVTYQYISPWIGGYAVTLSAVVSASSAVSLLGDSCRVVDGLVGAAS
jgi:hypothetical protein